MRIIKFRKNEKFKYKRKVIIKDLILNMSIGIHTFEKKKKQRVKINIEILTNPHVYPNNKDLTTILNYEEVVKKIEKLTHLKHHELIEDLAENIFNMLFKNKLVKKIDLRIEKLDIIKKTNSVGIEVSKSKNLQIQLITNYLKIWQKIFLIYYLKINLLKK